MQSQKRDRFVFAAGLVLTLTGLAKIGSVFGHARVLDTPDPLFGIAYRHLLLSVATLELAAASICFYSRNFRLNHYLIAWIATNFLIYRIALWFLGWEGNCRCLGSLTEVLNISDEVADVVSLLFMSFLLTGSYVKIAAKKFGGSSCENCAPETVM